MKKTILIILISLAIIFSLAFYMSSQDDETKIINEIPKEDAQYDIVIVGAGLSGLSSAYNLNDYNVLILEKENRAGGRVLTKTQEDINYDMGAIFAYPDYIVPFAIESSELIKESGPLGLYYNDKLYLRYEMPNTTVVNLSYQNYSEDDITVQNSYMIKVAEDRDIPESWSNLHKFGKGIYRFVVREQDVLKPWDYHVSAILPQVDSPAIINPMEQLSITQDKTFVFNFPTPMASQRYIYPAAEMDMICYSGADSSIQGGYTEVGQTGNDKYSEDKGQYSSISAPAPGSELEVTYRSPYTWHLDGTDYLTITPKDADGSYSTTPTGNPTLAGIANKKSHVDRRIYVGTYSTRPNGSGMRVFVQINGGSIRPEYSDNIDRKTL
mgnify:CR=1 FL=1